MDSIDRWADPTPPEMFTPDEATVSSIVARAGRAPTASPGRKIAVAAALLILLVIGGALGVRLVGTLFGETVLPPGGQPALGEPADYPSPQELALACDVAVVGQFDTDGFAVERVLKGEAGEVLSLPGGDTLRGWALVLLIKDGQGDWDYALTPMLFRQEGEGLRARTIAGDPILAYDQAYPKLTLEKFNALIEKALRSE